MTLKADALNWDACRDLARNMRAGDADECAANGRSPEEALALGLITGPCFGVYREETLQCLGAFGVSMAEGTIWSLWADGLTWLESFQAIRETPAWVRSLVAYSGRRQLHNYVDIANTVALEWLRLSGVFNVDTETLHQVGARTYLHFTTDGETVNV